MMQRGYLSNIAAHWPLARQHELLGERDSLYVDDLRPAALKRRDAADLKARAELLRPTGHTVPETIVVAAYPVLAWSWQDFGDVLGAASARNATLLALDTGLTLPPDASPALVSQVLQAFAKEARSRGLARSRPEIAAERRAETLLRIERIRHLWPLPEPPTRDLLDLAGDGKHPMAPATAKTHLGSRPKAQADYEREQARKEERATARARRKGRAT